MTKRMCDREKDEDADADAEVDEDGDSENEKGEGEDGGENGAGAHPGIRRSLFPNVPPYIKFCNGGALRPLPRSIRRLMRWKDSRITPMVVRRVVKNSGFLIREECACWSGTWANQIKCVEYGKLHDHQKFNHFPGTFQIGRKDYLWTNIQRMKQRHGERKFDIMPTTYVLPADKKAFRLMFDRSRQEPYWIVKPPASYRGDGIKIIRKYKQLPKAAPLIVQRYIHNPFLINGHKFDLRLYVLVTSVNPLRIYLSEHGLVRFASARYSADPRTLGDRYVHLTNYSVNKFNDNYVTNSDAAACKGHKWTLHSLWRFLQRERHLNVEQLRQSLNDLVIKTMLSVEEPLNKLCCNHLRSRYNAYELFGFDVLFDINMKPWLLEVNVSPSLHSASLLDEAVKLPLINDTLNMVGFHIPVSKRFSDEELAAQLQLGQTSANPLFYDNRMYTPLITKNEKFKHYNFSNKFNRSDYLDKILTDLTPDDVRHLIVYEDELTQLGSFEKIFPTTETHKYFKYLEKLRYHNLLLDAWEAKYHNTRHKGVQLLRNLCQQKFHLRVARKNEAATLL